MLLPGWGSGVPHSPPLGDNRGEEINHHLCSDLSIRSYAQTSRRRLHLRPEAELPHSTKTNNLSPTWEEPRCTVHPMTTAKCSLETSLWGRKSESIVVRGCGGRLLHPRPPKGGSVQSAPDYVSMGNRVRDRDIVSFSDLDGLFDLRT